MYSCCSVRRPVAPLRKRKERKEREKDEEKRLLDLVINNTIDTCSYFQEREVCQIEKSMAKRAFDQAFTPNCEATMLKNCSICHLVFLISRAGIPLDPPTAGNRAQELSVFSCCITEFSLRLFDMKYYRPTILWRQFNTTSYYIIVFKIMHPHECYMTANRTPHG